jgi:hypothetical protein
MIRIITVTAIILCCHLLSAADLPRSPIDLKSIPRTIKVEPACKSDSPRYCLAVFGDQAAHRVWLVHDGDQLFVDRNGDGELIEPAVPLNEAKYFDIGQPGFPDIGERYTYFRVEPKTDGTYRIRVKVKDRGLQYVGAMASTRPKFGDTPASAPIVHFDGRMTLGRYGDRETLPREIGGLSYRRTSLKLMVGTPGLGKGTFAAYHCKCRRDKTMVGKIEYPTGGNTPTIIGVDYQMHG